MANVLKGEVRARILELLGKQWTLRAIQRDTGCTVNTISRYRDNAEPPVVRSVTRKKGPHSPWLNPEPKHCLCGCGGVPTRYDCDDRKAGKRKGEYRDWVAGHRWKSQRKAADPTYLTLPERRARCDAVRAALVKTIYHDRTLKREDVLDALPPTGMTRQNLGRLLKKGIADPSYHLHDGELTLPGSRPPKPRPREEPYERKHIPHETATEVSYLTRRYGVMSLDSRVSENGSMRHELLPSLSMDPAEAMMLAEEQHDQQELTHRRVAFSTWTHASAGLVCIAEALEAAA